MKNKIKTAFKKASIATVSFAAGLVVFVGAISVYANWMDTKNPDDPITSLDWNQMSAQVKSWVRVNESAPDSNVRLGTTGNVGIGTDAPTAKLEVEGGDGISIKGTAGILRLYEDDNPNIWWVVADNNHFSIRKNNTHPHSFVINGNSDNVGIGVEIPAEKLEVDGNVKISGALTFGTTENLRPGTIRYKDGNFEGRDETSWTTLGGSGGGSSVWSENGSDIYYNSGNIGVGTDVPTAKLEVAGDIKADSMTLAATYSPNDAQDVATKKYVDDIAAGGSGGWTLLGTANEGEAVEVSNQLCHSVAGCMIIMKQKINATGEVSAAAISTPSHLFTGTDSFANTWNMVINTSGTFYNAIATDGNGIKEDILGGVIYDDLGTNAENITVCDLTSDPNKWCLIGGPAGTTRYLYVR